MFVLNQKIGLLLNINGFGFLFEEKDQSIRCSDQNVILELRVETELLFSQIDIFDDMNSKSGAIRDPKTFSMYLFG